jgi:hypothetical protein
MPWSSEHIKFLKKQPDVKNTEGKTITVLEFDCSKISDKAYSSWAKHFRNHYCFDDEIDVLREGTGHSKKDYLNKLKFPTDDGLGPSIRAGDFGEILVADYVEYVLNYWVPRTRYGNKTIRNESSKGTDLIGFKVIDDSESPNDILAMFEAKTQFSGKKALDRLQNAVDGSAKDELRKAESLNAIKQRLFDRGKTKEAKTVARFQNPVDKPYKEQYAAAALFSSNVFDQTTIAKTITKKHPGQKDLILVVIHGDQFMTLVNNLYKRAADEA